MELANQGERLVWVDRLKGLLILLVVLGHAFGGGGNLATGETASHLLSIRWCIYQFHMPAFFLLVGYVWKYREGEGFVSVAAKKARRLLVPYAIFFAVSSLIYAFTVGYPVWWQPIASFLHAGGWPNGTGFQCNSVLWFLPVMFVSSLLWWLLERVCANATRLAKTGVHIGLCVALWSLRFYCYQKRIWFLPWGVVSVLWYLPFIIVGYDIGYAVRRFSFDRHGIAFWACAFLFIAIQLCNGCYLMRWDGFCCQIAVSVFGALACFAFSQLSIWKRSAFSRVSTVLMQLGVLSMGIMVLHKFPIVFLQEYVGFVRATLNGRFVVAFVSVLAVSCVSAGLSYWFSVLLKRHAKWIGI